MASDGKTLTRVDLREAVYAALLASSRADAERLVDEVLEEITAAL